MLHINSTQRFSSRVGNYARCRPPYPPEIVEILRQECGLTSESVVADVASGTGIFTRLLLENGNRVYGVEPNEAICERRARNILRAILSSPAYAGRLKTQPCPMLPLIS